MKTISLRALGRDAPNLGEIVYVTLEGVVIGRFVPINIAIDDRALAGTRPGEPVLGGSFGTSRPAPKPGTKR